MTMPTSTITQSDDYTQMFNRLFALPTTMNEQGRPPEDIQPLCIRSTPFHV
jgi:hypothetical protein